MIYEFSSEEVQKIRGHFGEVFFIRLQQDIPRYSKRWGINEMALVDYFSVNCVFKCHSQIYGSVVMKIGKTNREVCAEYNCLHDYHGKGFCQVFDADLEEGVLLETCIEPGTRLRDESSLEKRLENFASLYEGLHIEPKDASLYPTYLGWVSRISSYIQNLEDHNKLAYYIKSAEVLCRDLIDGQGYSRQMLLHGDFHHDNILLGDNGKYHLIDPKGVIGDPIFDIARFILNEDSRDMPTDACYKHIEGIVNSLSIRLGIPEKVLKTCYFIEATMAICWDVEDAGKADMECVRIADLLMKGD